MEVGEKVLFPSSCCASFGQAVQASYSWPWLGWDFVQVKEGPEPSSTRENKVPWSAVW